MIIKLPGDTISKIFTFLNGESLLCCSMVNKDWYKLTTHTRLWEAAAFDRWYRPVLNYVFVRTTYYCAPRPHLKETYDVFSTYDGDWRDLYVDGDSLS